MGEGGALRPAGGATGVEQPCCVGGSVVDQSARRSPYESRPVGSGGHHGRLQGGHGADECLDIVGVFLVGDHHARCAVVEDVGDLLSVQSCIHRYGYETRMPDGEQGLEVLRPVAHHDGNSVAGHEPELLAQPAGHSGGGACVGGPVGVHAAALGQGGMAGERAPVSFHPGGEVHRGWSFVSPLPCVRAAL